MSTFTSEQYIDFSCCAKATGTVVGEKCSTSFFFLYFWKWVIKYKRFLLQQNKGFKQAAVDKKTPKSLILATDFRIPVLEKISLCLKYCNAMAKGYYVYISKSVMLLICGLKNSWRMQESLQSQSPSLHTQKKIT